MCVCSVANCLQMQKESNCATCWRQFSTNSILESIGVQMGWAVDAAAVFFHLRRKSLSGERLNFACTRFHLRVRVGIKGKTTLFTEKCLAHRDDTEQHPLVTHLYRSNPLNGKKKPNASSNAMQCCCRIVSKSKLGAGFRLTKLLCCCTSSAFPSGEGRRLFQN